VLIGGQRHATSLSLIGPSATETVIEMQQTVTESPHPRAAASPSER
jgi:hypothetical protein